MKSKYVALLIVNLTLLFTTSASGQDQFSFKKIEGGWKGTLEYADYKDGKRVKLKTAVEIKSSENGRTASLKFIYDDFGKIYRDTSEHRIDFVKGQYSLAGDKFSFIQTAAGKLILTGSGVENGKKELYRITLSVDKENLRILKETRTPFQFRNEYKLKRVSNQKYTQRNFTSRQLKEDFGILKKALKELHPGLYRYNTPAEMEKKFDAFEKKLNKTLPEGEFFKLFSQLLSEIKCYHTYPNPFNQKKEIREGLFNRKTHFPFYFSIIDRKMIVTENASSRKLPRGSEIKKINGVPVKRIIEFLLTTTFSDGNGTIEHRLKSLEVDRGSGAAYANFDLMFPLFFQPRNLEYEIEAVDFKRRKLTKFKVPAMTKAERSAEMEKRYGKSPTYDDLWKFEIGEDKTAYLKIGSFITWKLTFDFKKFLSDSFGEMKAKGAKNLIIDIRGNGGGDDNAYIELFKYMSKRDLPCKFPTKQYIRTAKADDALFKYISTYDKQIEQALRNGLPESIYRKTDNGLLEFLRTDRNQDCKPINPYPNNFNGKIFLLIDSSNASAAFTFAQYAKEYNLATLVGQETGGNRKGFNGSSYLFITLPNSKFEFDIPIFATFPITDQEDTGEKPDFYVERKVEDIGRNIDRELLKVRTLIEN